MEGYEEDPCIYNGHYEVEITIRAPVGRVWSQHLDVSSWVVTHDIRHAYGAPGTVGSVNWVSFKRASEFKMPRPHHHYTKIIKLVPNHQYVIKTYAEKGGSYGWGMVAFDDTRFFECGAETRVTFNLYAENRSSFVLEEPGLMDKAMEASWEGMRRNLQNLKRILEG